MTGGFDGVNSVEVVFWEGHLLGSGLARDRAYSMRLRTMKSPLIKFNWFERPSLAAYLVARSIW